MKNYDELIDDVIMKAMDYREQYSKVSNELNAGYKAANEILLKLKYSPSLQPIKFTLNRYYGLDYAKVLANGLKFLKDEKIIDMYYYRVDEAVAEITLTLHDEMHTALLFEDVPIN